MELITAHSEGLNDSWEIAADLRSIEYEMVCRVAVIEDHDYDDARRIIGAFSEELSKKIDLDWALNELKRILFSEQKNVLRRFLADECGVSKDDLEDVIKQTTNLDELRLAAESISRKSKGASSIDYNTRIRNWEKSVEDLARRFFYTLDMDRKLRHDLSSSLFKDPLMAPYKDLIEINELHEIVKFIFLRVSNAPRLKDLSKPTVVLIGGTSGTGKSTISRHITRTLSFPVYSSTDVLARQVVRKVISWSIGSMNSRDTFPELYGSSFEGSDLKWYYAHSTMTMVGMIGIMNRLINEGTSAVIEGVPLIPGMLPERFFELANIVWIVTGISDQEEHFSRYAGRDKAGISRGGSERYRKRFKDIRMIHDRLNELAERAGTLWLDNSGDLEDSLSFAMDRVKDPFADKGLRIDDDLRDLSISDLSHRRKMLRIERDNGEKEVRTFRPHSSPEICGPSLENIDEAVSLWISHSESVIKRTEKELEKKAGSMDKEMELGLRSSIEKRKKDIRLASEILSPRMILEVLRKNFEYLRATRSLLIQLRSLHVHFLTRLASLPGINYDEAKSEVFEFFKKRGDTKDLESARSSIKELMFKELLHNIRGFLENEYNIDGSRIDKVFGGITDLESLSSSIGILMGRIFLVKAKIELSSLQISNIIKIWEENLDRTIKKNFDIYLQWRNLEDAEMDLLYSDGSIFDLREEFEKEELHRLIRWITPRLYEVPKVKNLEKRPTLILINGTAGTDRTNILKKISTELSIPTCIRSGLVEEALKETLYWLFGKAVMTSTFPSFAVTQYEDLTVDSFYEKAVISMIGIRGALDRLIKENTSGVVIGSTVIPSMLEEKYFENANIISMATTVSDEEKHFERMIGQKGSDDTEEQPSKIEERFNNIRMINEQLIDLADCGHILVLDGAVERSSKLDLLMTRVTSPYADRGLPVMDDVRDRTEKDLEQRMDKLSTEGSSGFNGAILTDIDDTLIPSGVTPDDNWVASFSEILKILSKHRILWAPMSGVAISKLGKRLLYRLPRDTLNNIVAYLGDGSNKLQFDDLSLLWTKDPDFTREFSDTQAVSIIGSERYHEELMDFSGISTDKRSLLERIERSIRRLEEHNEKLDPGIPMIDPQRGLIGEIEDKLKNNGLPDTLKEEGYEIMGPQTYFRGGSVSWMMLGDISAEPYELPDSLLMRKGNLIPYVKKRLMEQGSLEDLGTYGVHVPFPGARGIKFVLMGNDKKRGATDLIVSFGIPEESVLFIGNELFEGGNDNMLRNIDGITLMSVGSKEDPGVIDGGVGVDANWSMMKQITEDLEKGFGFSEILKRLGKSE